MKIQKKGMKLFLKVIEWVRDYIDRFKPSWRITQLRKVVDDVYSQSFGVPNFEEFIWAMRDFQHFLYGKSLFSQGAELYTIAQLRDENLVKYRFHVTDVESYNNHTSLIESFHTEVLDNLARIEKEKKVTFRFSLRELVQVIDDVHGNYH